MNIFCDKKKLKLMKRTLSGMRDTDLDSTVIECKTEMKYLGITLDQKTFAEEAYGIDHE